MAQFESIKFQPQRPLLRELSADRLNTILTEIRRNKPKGERGITVRQSGDGTYIGLAATLPASGSASTRRPPWTIYITESDESSYTVRVQPGTISRILPSNWDDEWTISSESLGYAVVNIETDGQFIIGAEIDIITSEPTQQTPQKFGLENNIQILFGLFQEGVSFNLTDGADIDVSAQAVLATSADPPAAPGESPYDIYFKLE